MADLNLKESVIVIAGARGVGKSYAALTYLPPSRLDEVFVHDGEGSSNRAYEQLERAGLKFGYRINLDDRWASLNLPGQSDLIKRIRAGRLPWATTKEKDAMIAYWEFVLEDIDKNMTPGKFNAYIHDPVDRFESAMQAWVDVNRDAAGWKRKAYGEMWTKGYYPLYRGFLSALRQRGIDATIFTAHLGNPWANGAPIPGKVRPKAKPELYLLSQLYLWVVHEPANQDGAPAAIVLKERLGTLEANTETDTWNIERRIPRRVPHFTWDDLEDYLLGKRPCNLANPALGESLTADENTMISEALSDKQLQLMLLHAQTTLTEAQSAMSSVISVDVANPIDMQSVGTPERDYPAEAKQLANDGKTVAEIVTLLGKPLPLVRRWVGTTI